MGQRAGEKGRGLVRREWRVRRWVALAGLAVPIAYLVGAYVVVPRIWKRAMAKRPDLSGMPRATTTSVGIPGDPLNVALVGSRKEILAAMAAAGWYVADSLSWRSDERIVFDTLLHRPYVRAPVSRLYLFGREEDLAFEKPVGTDPRQRQHVRFWRVGPMAEGREVWIGAATFDRSVGLSHTTGQVTHHIAPDVDAERDQLMRDLRTAGEISDTYRLRGFQARSGRNGGGDPYRSDGALVVGVIRRRLPIAQDIAGTG